MGCGSSSAIIENNEMPKEEKEENNNFYESKEKQIAIKKVTEKQNEIIEKFNKKKGNSKNVGLSNISSCYIKFWNSNKGIKYTVESNAENVLKFLENINPFNEEIKKNKDINNLQTELNETEMYYSNIIKSNSPKSQNLQIKSTQKIHNNYNPAISTMESCTQWRAVPWSPHTTSCSIKRSLRAFSGEHTCLRI